MKNSFVRNRFVVSRNLAFRDKARELSRKGAGSSDGSQMIFEYNRGAPSYPTDVLPDGNQTRIKTASGIRTATYDALNRPISYTRENEDGTQSVITAALALIYDTYRHYNPLDRRWARRDPIGLKGGMNLYEYVKSTPHTKVLITVEKQRMAVVNIALAGAYYRGVPGLGYSAYQTAQDLACKQEKC